MIWQHCQYVIISLSQYIYEAQDESYCNVASFLDEDEHNILRGKQKDVLK